MKTLHILRNINDQFACTMIEAGMDASESAVLLMQDAVYDELSFDSIKIFACEEDTKARQIESRYQKVSFDEIARMVVAYDRTIVW